MSEKLNCWPGCWAIVVGLEKSDGRIVRVDRLARHGDEVIDANGDEWRIQLTGPVWLLSSGVVFAETPPVDAPVCSDKHLRPLRDDEGEDEMLRIAGLPNKETTPAAH